MVKDREIGFDEAKKLVDSGMADCSTKYFDADDRMQPCYCDSVEEAIETRWDSGYGI